jgi:hypothetical protein
MSALNKSEADLEQKRLEYANGVTTKEELDSAGEKYDKAYKAYEKEASDHYSARASNFRGPNNVQILN